MTPQKTSLLSLAAAFLMASGAAAHISLDQGGTHLSRYGDNEIKQEPCGRAGGTRSTNVYTYRPGETITVALVEFIGHPGYFRIAFDADGDDDFVDPQYVDPINRECMPDPIDHCGQTDFFNNEAVLMDDLEPHVPMTFEGSTYSFDVTLPNVTCDNCTLQVIQVMTDAPGIHAPYDPEGVNADDIYYQCIDLVLQGEPVGGTPVPDAGGGPPPSSSDAAPLLPGLMPADSESSGDEGCGCSLERASSLTETSAGIFAAALALLIRRRRRSADVARS